MAKPGDYHDYMKAVLSATYHRTAAMMSSPKDVKTLYEAALWCSQNTDLGGKVAWVREGRMFTWRGASVYGIDTSHLRFIGITPGRKPTIIMRVGWYKMHFAMAKALGLSPERFPAPEIPELPTA